MTPTTTSDFVLPVRPARRLWRWMSESRSHCKVSVRAYAGVSMVRCPVLGKDLQSQRGRHGSWLARLAERRPRWLPAACVWAVLVWVTYSNTPFAQEATNSNGKRAATEQLPLETQPSVATKNSTQGDKSATVCQTLPGEGPEMVILPPGKFTMGDANSDESDEKPAREVTIQHAFALGRCEVTVGEFRRFVEAENYKTSAELGGGCFTWDVQLSEWKQMAGVNWQQSGFESFELQEQHPAVCISWVDANQYIAWLNKTLGLTVENGYRLPTEAEFEYALRAGSSSDYPWRELEQCDYSNGADASLSQHITGIEVAVCDDKQAFVAPVGSYPPNPFGLFDSSGNVWEWTEDCWHENYTNAPLDASAWLESGDGACGLRVLRGGGWYSLPRDLRSASRSGSSRDDASSLVGFRLARTLGPMRSDP